MILEAGPKDLDQLCILAERFVQESGLPLTFDSKQARETLWTAICVPDQILLVDKRDDLITGAIMGAVSHDFCNQKMAYVTKFYVEKIFRGTEVSRNLVIGFEAAARALDADMVFASATAGMGERVEKLYVRLFEKHGYNVLGRILMKELNDG